MRLKLNKSLIPSTLFPTSALKYITAKVTDGTENKKSGKCVNRICRLRRHRAFKNTVKNSCNGSAGNAERPLGSRQNAGTAGTYRWARWASSAPAGASCKESSALWRCRTSWSASSHYCRTTPATVSSATWGTHRKHSVKTRVKQLQLSFHSCLSSLATC